MKPTIRCSELDRILNCPGSRKLVSLVAPRQGGEGHEGTKIHWDIAWKAVNELGAEQPEGGIPLPNLPPGYQFIKFSEWIVNYCFRFLEESVPEDFALEVEAAAAYEFDRFILSGHLDALALNFDATEAIGFDWKTVYVAVDPAEMNEQILGYIILLVRAYPTLKKITFHVVQPRVSEEDGHQRISTITIEGATLSNIVERFEARVNAALDRENEIETGRTQCAWCPAMLQCPAIHRELETMKMTLTPELLAKIKSEADDATLANIVLSAKVLERPIDDARSLIKNRIAAQGEVVAHDGTRITIKTTNGAYKILDAVAFYNGVHELVSNRAILAKALSYPVGALKDALAEDRGIPRTGKSGQSAEEIFNAALAPYCEQGTRKLLQFN